MTAVLAIAFVALTWTRVDDYREEITIWREAERHQPLDPLVHVNLSKALFVLGSVPEALEHCREAIQLKPGDESNYNNLGHLLLMSGRTQESLEPFKAALELVPDYPEAQANLGAALLNLGQLDQAPTLIAQSSAAAYGRGSLQSRLGTFPAGATCGGD